jgi:hypothetical protein
MKRIRWVELSEGQIKIIQEALEMSTDNRAPFLLSLLKKVKQIKVR